MASHVEALTHILSQADRWSAPAVTPGDAVMTDPFTGQQVNPNEPLAWIARDPTFSSGLEYLRSRRDDLTFKVAYGVHEVAEDLGDMNKNWYEQQVAAADYYGFEGSLNTVQTERADHALARRAIRRAIICGKNPTRESFLQFKMSNTFYARMLAARTLLPTVSFSYDLAADGTLAERALSVAYRDVFKSRYSEAVKARAFIGMTAAREWCMVAKLGSLLSFYEKDNTRPVETFMTIGAAHTDVSRKLRLQGTVVDPKYIISSRQINEYEDALNDVPAVMRSGIIAKNRMGTFIDIARDVQAKFTTKSPN
ncbi:MAG TPA: hypothetical protein VLG16_00405 [Candidatus Saccharimonadales bacterium]|nr:hypothetical protein [Candidatus Saccharimonadales bacterium]